MKKKAHPFSTSQRQRACPQFSTSRIKPISKSLHMKWNYSYIIISKFIYFSNHIPTNRSSTRIPFHISSINRIWIERQGEIIPWQLGSGRKVSIELLRYRSDENTKSVWLCLDDSADLTGTPLPYRRLNCAPSILYLQLHPLRATRKQNRKIASTKFGWLCAHERFVNYKHSCSFNGGHRTHLSPTYLPGSRIWRGAVPSFSYNKTVFYDTCSVLQAVERRNMQLTC